MRTGAHMKKKQHEALDVATQLIPVHETKLSTSLEQLSIEQLFELLKITIEIEDSEHDLIKNFPTEASPKTVH